MFWLIAIVVVLVIVFSMSGAAEKVKEAQKREEFNALAQSRISAYGDYLRRTSENPLVQAMTDNELRDFLQINIREYSSEIKIVQGISAGIVIVGVIAGVIFAAAKSAFGPLLFFSAAGFFIGVAVNKKWANALTPKYERRGLDVGRLKIEE